MFYNLQTEVFAVTKNVRVILCDPTEFTRRKKQGEFSPPALFLPTKNIVLYHALAMISPRSKVVEISRP